MSEAIPPGFVRLRAPENFGSAVINGRTISASPDGNAAVFFLPNEVDTMKSHGFNDWDYIPPTAADLNHAQLVEEAIKRETEVIRKLSLEELRIRLGVEVEKVAEVPASTPAPVVAPTPFAEEEMIAEPSVEVVAEEVTRESLPGLHRIDLFRFLKSEGIPTEAKMKNAELRELAEKVFENRELFDVSQALLAKEAAYEHIEPEFEFGTE